MNRELAEIFLTPDGNPVAGSSREDLDLDKISAYFRDVYDLEIKSMDREELDTLLVNSSIAVRVHSKLCAGIAGLLFFGNRQRLGSALETHLPHAGIQFVVYEDDDMGSIIDRFDCYETSPESVDAVVHRIRLSWKTPSVIKGLKREEIAFPEGIFRELVVNAVVHRDYSIRGKTRIKMCRGIPMVIRKIQKLPGFKFHLQEYDDAFSASVEFPFL